MVNEKISSKWRPRAKYCSKHSSELNDWEQAFVDDIIAKLDRNEELTIKQSFKLGEIFHRIE